MAVYQLPRISFTSLLRKLSFTQQERRIIQFTSYHLGHRDNSAFNSRDSNLNPRAFGNCVLLSNIHAPFLLFSQNFPFSLSHFKRVNRSINFRHIENYFYNFGTYSLFDPPFSHVYFNHLTGSTSICKSFQHSFFSFSSFSLYSIVYVSRRTTNLDRDEKNSCSSTAINLERTCRTCKNLHARAN